MAMIRPSSDLRNHYNEISEFCHKYNRPVYITKNGAGDLVVLSNAEYERLTAREELHHLLDEGLKAAESGKGIPADEFFKNLEKEYGFEEV
ncbi:MAG: type II toxin-antitoxin system Phd/YefM family antitoxin [Ruminococcus sp.]|nr:type II toxin-antitoxin system Phd/YefM family antitoxin [Ruminococcus sp.]